MCLTLSLVRQPKITNMREVILTIECSKRYNEYKFTYLLISWRSIRRSILSYSTGWMSRLNPHFDLQNDHLLRSPPCNTQIQQRKRGRRFSKLFCHAVIDAKPHELHIKMWQIYSCVQIWWYICYSKHALSKKSSFLRPSGFPAGRAFKNLPSNPRKKR